MKYVLLGLCSRTESVRSDARTEHVLPDPKSSHPLFLE